MQLKIKRKNILIVAIVIFLLLKLGFAKALMGAIANDASVDTAFNLLYLFILFLIVVCSGLPKNRELWITNILCIVALLLSLVHGYISGNHLTPGPVLSKSLNYLFVLLSIPIYKLLKKGIWDFDKYIKTLVFLCICGYGIRAIISIVYFFTKKVVLEGIAFDSASNFYRYGMIRVNPPCLSLIFLPLCYYLLCREKNKKTWWGGIILHFLYAFFVYMARSFIIYSTLVLLLMYAFIRTSTLKKLFRYIIIAGFIIFAINTTYFENLVNSFSNESNLAISTLNRMRAYTYAFGVIKSNPYLGSGMVNYNIVENGGSLSDIGFLLSISQMGIPIVLFYVYTFFCGFKAAFNNRLRNPDYAILAFGSTLSVLIIGVSIDCFFNVFAFSTPFYIAIIMYILQITNKKRTSIRTR